MRRATGELPRMVGFPLYSTPCIYENTVSVNFIPKESYKQVWNACQ